MSQNYNCGSVNNIPIQDYQGQICVLQAQNQLEAARHSRYIEKEMIKSQNRQDEYFNRQQQKIQTAQIFEGKNRIVLQVYNGLGNILRTELLFSCQIKSVFRFRRDRTNVCEWMVEIEDDNKKICSKLYSISELKSISKLKKTILGRYDCTVTSNDKRIAWQWVQGKLFDLYERATETVIPSLAGWFLNNRSWNFWVNCEDKSFLAGEIVNRFTIDNFADLSLEEIIDEIRAASGKITTSTNLGILLIFRLYALLSRLLTDSPPSMSTTLVGKNAVDVAKIFLRTMQCANFDIFNLDSDNISWIEKRVLELQDTPIIFVCSDPANRTAQSRLEKIKGWLGSGYIAGRKVTTPFIFCLKTFSPKYLFEHSILIFTDDIKVPYNFTAFAKLQNFVVSKIETGGLHWADELKKQYLNLSNKEEESVLTVGKAIVLVLFEILDLDNDSKISFQQIFDLAFWEIKKQLLMEQSIILEEFKNGICELFENGVLVSSLIKKESFIGEKN